jgi:glycosyltransferase involved in cell wall biosynthesis
LARRGLRVAHIVLPLEDPVQPADDGLTVVQRRPFATGDARVARVTEAARIWRALAEADASVYVFRSGLPAVGIGALFVQARRRRLVFASASNLDFTGKLERNHRVETRLYRHGLLRADTIVLQTAEQVELARARLGPRHALMEIPSFAQPGFPARDEPEAFLWTGRLDAIKQPMRYVELAAALPEARFWMIPKFAESEESEILAVLARAPELPNLELLDMVPHEQATEVIARSVATVSTAPAEGMPNFFLEGWARGVPALSFEFDPDGRIEARGLGVAAGGSWERFTTGARELWNGRLARDGLSERVQAYIREEHDPEVVAGRWFELIEELTG